MKQDPRPERIANTLPDLSEQRKPAVTLSTFENPFQNPSGSSSKFPSHSANWPGVFSRSGLSLERPSNQERQSSSSSQVKSTPTAPWGQKLSPNVEPHTDDQNIFESASEDDQEQMSAALVDQGIPAVGQSSLEDSEAAENDRPEKRMKLDMSDATTIKSQSKPVPISNAELGRRAQVQPALGQNPPFSAAALSFLEKAKQVTADAQRRRELRIARKGS